MSHAEESDLISIEEWSHGDALITADHQDMNELVDLGLGFITEVLADVHSRCCLASWWRTASSLGWAHRTLLLTSRAHSSLRACLSHLGLGRARRSLLLLHLLLLAFHFYWFYVLFRSFKKFYCSTAADSVFYTTNIYTYILLIIILLSFFVHFGSQVLEYFYSLFLSLSSLFIFSLHIFIWKGRVHDSFLKKV